MTYTRALSNIRAVTKKPTAPKEIIVPTTDLFEAYIEAISSRNANRKYSVCTLENGNWHWIIENATPAEIVKEITVQYLCSGDAGLPFYYLRVEGLMMTSIISQKLYAELKFKEEMEEANEKIEGLLK